MSVDVKHEAAVAKALGGTIETDDVLLPMLRWPDGFLAEVSVAGDDNWFEVASFPCLREDGTSHLEEIEVRKYADFLRAVQDYATQIGRGIYIEGESRSKVGHILDHLGFHIAQRTVEDNEFWGEDFDDTDYEWRPA